MKLLNLKTNEPVIEFQKNDVHFYNRIFEQEMREIGIMIPPGLRGLYGKDYVRLGEAEFQKAFKEVYYVTAMDPEIFKWID